MSDLNGSIGASHFNSYLTWWGGTSAAMRSGIGFSAGGSSFRMSSVCPSGVYVPPGAKPNLLYWYKIAKQNKMLRLRYGDNMLTGTRNWHWNQRGVSSVYGLTDHATGGAAAAGRTFTTLKWAGRGATALAVGVSAYDIATSPEPDKELVRQVGGWAGAWAGAWLGPKGGGLAGAQVGVWTGGAALPYTVPGGTILGGIGGAYAGWKGGYKGGDVLTKIPTRSSSAPIPDYRNWWYGH